MTMIASKAGDVSLSVSSKKGLDTSTRTLHAASLGVMVMHAALLISDDLLVKHRVLQHERECQQKKEEKERGIAASLEEEEVLGDHKKGRTKNLKNRCKSKPSSSFSLNEAHSHEYSGQEAVFQAAKCVSQAMDEAQDSMMKETLREIQAMKYILQHLEELEEFISQLRNKLDQWTQDLKNEGKFNALLALLKEHFKNDPQMLKKLNSLNLGDALAKQSEWDGRADVTKFFDNMFGIDQDKEHALTNFMNCVGKMCMESEKRGLGTQPLLLAVTRNEEKDFKKVIKKAISQVNQLLAILVLLEGGTKGKGFSHNQEEIFKAMALVMGVMEMLIQNNAKKSQQQIEISRLNVAIQTHNYEAAKKALQKIQEQINPHNPC